MGKELRIEQRTSLCNVRSACSCFPPSQRIYIRAENVPNRHKRLRLHKLKIYEVFSGNGEIVYNVVPKNKNQKAPNEARRESGSKPRERGGSSHVTQLRELLFVGYHEHQQLRLVQGAPDKFIELESTKSY